MPFDILEGDDIASFEIRQAILTPAEAQLHLFAALTTPIENAELRGKLHGPRCQYSSTVEIAYPVRPLPRKSEEPNVVAGRIIIPEPCLWDTDSPFVYEGRLEIRRDRSSIAKVDVSHALRTVQVAPDGRVRLNGRDLNIRAVDCSELDESKLRQWRDAGVNALRVTTEETTEIRRLADRFGFLVLPKENH